MKQAKFYYKNVSAPKPNRPNHIGVSIIIDYNNQILLEHRVDSERWAIIGGGLQVDENLKSCAIREVFEETGQKLNKKDLQFYNIYDDPSRIAHYPEGNVLRVFTVVYITKLLNYPVLKTSLESRSWNFFQKMKLWILKLLRHIFPLFKNIITYNNLVFAFLYMYSV